MIDLLPSAEQRQILDATVAFLAERLPVERLRDADAAAGAAEAQQWTRLAELGWFGLAMPEEVGGAGFTVAEEVLVHRELGRFLVSPAVLAAALAAQLAHAAGDAALAQAIIRGERRAGLALARGELELVPGAVDGDLYLADAQTAELLVLWTDAEAVLLPRDGLRGISAVVPMDRTVALERATACRLAPVCLVPAARAPIGRRATLLLAAALAGIAEAARDRAVAYAKIREQFGKPIGAFQAIAHHCADMALRARAASAQTVFAAVAERDGRGDAAFQVAAAATVAAEAAVWNATLSIRVHGGIGFSAENDAHHFLKRAHLLEMLAGGARRHRAPLLAGPGEA